MSMYVFYLINFILTLLLYTFVTVGLPALVLSKKLSGYSKGFRFLFYMTIGNFFICSLVICLELMHICSGPMLVICTAAAAGAAYIKIYKKAPYSELKKTYSFIVKVMTGRIGLRTSFVKLRKGVFRYIKAIFSKAVSVLRTKKTDIILLTGVVILVIWRFGYRIVKYFGYAASDIVVHNNWINGLDSGIIYSKGIYPNGFHCVIYYIHAVFGVDIYILLGVFWLVQLLFIIIASVVLLKICCKNRFLPYLLPVLYVILTMEFVGSGVYSRFFASLPQEFGMIFIIPAIYFIFYYLKKPDMPLICLAGFAMSLSMTITVHFYDTIVLGMFCIGGAVGYCFRIFRKKYLIGILKFGLAGVFAAVFPMVVAFITGTPLQGSLQWGIGVVSGKADSGAENISEVSANPDMVTNIASGQYDKNQFDNVLFDKIKNLFIEVSHIFFSNINFAYAAAAAVTLLVVTGILILIFGDRNYGARNVTIGTGTLILICMITAKILGIPQIMERSRCYTYFSLFIIYTLILLFDTVLYILPGRVKLKRFYNAAAVLIDGGVIVLTAVHMYNSGISSFDARYEMNESIACLTNIIRSNDDNTWTICSANDEREMAGTHGRHYELVDFLYGMEDDISGKIIIPTQKVYFFIEKTAAGKWYDIYEGSGHKISAELAEKPLPAIVGYSAYQGENRCILMSRLYCWAQEYMKMYPNEMKTYYENDNFVCYYIEQNPASLYNFAIDYGYNRS